jgi:alpha-methylacyl-CoA racemase
MSVGGLEPQFYTAMKNIMGLVDPPDRNDLAQWPALRKVLAEAFAGKTQAEWTALFDGTDACVAPVVPMHEAAKHPHNAARGTYVEHDGLIQAAPAPRFSATPANLTTPPAKSGANTTEALAAWGFTDIDSLLADGVAVQAD